MTTKNCRRPSCRCESRMEYDGYCSQHCAGEGAIRPPTGHCACGHPACNPTSCEPRVRCEAAGAVSASRAHARLASAARILIASYTAAHGAIFVGLALIVSALGSRRAPPSHAGARDDPRGRLLRGALDRVHGLALLAGPSFANAQRIALVACASLLASIAMAILLANVIRKRWRRESRLVPLPAARFLGSVWLALADRATRRQASRDVRAPASLRDWDRSRATNAVSRSPSAASTSTL